MTLEFKKATLLDLDVLQQISIETFKATYESQNDPIFFADYLQESFSEQVFKKELENPSIDYYLVSKEKDLIGYFKINEASAQTDINDSSALEVERIYLKQKYQGFGLGRKLIEAIVQIGNRRHKEYIWLGVWTKNENAIAFYKKMGFTIFDTHIFKIGQEAQEDFLMKLILKNSEL